jgi:hypothetical protein
MARSIQAHEGPVWAMSLYGKTLVTVSQDKTVSLPLNSVKILVLYRYLIL